jgi:hypothetical protein
MNPSNKHSGNWVRDQLHQIGSEVRCSELAQLAAVQDDLFIFKSLQEHQEGRSSSFAIATSYGLDDREVGVRVHIVQTGSGVQKTSYTMGIGPFPRG